MIKRMSIKSTLAACLAIGVWAGALLSMATAQTPAPAAPQGGGRLRAVPMADKVARADAIVVSKMTDVQLKRYRVTLYDNGSNGTKSLMNRAYDFAELHPEQVLKTDSPTMVNSVDASNPVAWMHMGYMAESDVGEGPPYAKPKVGDYKIWFMTHEKILTGNYFLIESMDVTDARVNELKQIIADQAKK